MKLQRLISAGFAITAVAAASAPAVGWTLLGAVDAPAVSVQTPWDPPPLFMAELSMPTVALERLAPEGSTIDRTPW